MACEEKPIIYTGAGEVCEIETATIGDTGTGILFADLISAQVVLTINGATVGTYSTVAGTVVEGSTETSIKWLILESESLLFDTGILMANISLVIPNTDFPSNEQTIRFQLYFADINEFPV